SAAGPTHPKPTLSAASASCAATSSSSRSSAATTCARAIPGGCFKRCCLKGGRYDGALRAYYIPRLSQTQTASGSPPIGTQSVAALLLRTFRQSGGAQPPGLAGQLLGVAAELRRQPCPDREIRPYCCQLGGGASRLVHAAGLRMNKNDVDQSK